MNSRHLSRKFLIAAAVVLSALLALMTDQIGETVFRDLLLGAMGLYGAANVAQKKIEKAPT